MATFHNGNGGAIIGNSVALPTIDAEIKEHNRVGETTNSAGTRATWLGTVTEADFRCTVVFDSTALMITDNGVTPGNSVTVRGDLGDSGKFYTGTAVIEDVRHYWNNRQGVVEAEVTGKYSGTLTQPVT